LRERGAVPFYLDSQVGGFQVDDVPVGRIEAPSRERETFTAGIVLSGDSTVDPRELTAVAPLWLDAGGGHVLRHVLPDWHRL
jgi:hypothetical protein